jgi:transposase-like protein
MLGLKKGIKRRNYERFSEEDKRTIIEDYLQSGLTKKEIWEKYTGRRAEHGLILYWMYKYGYFSTQKNVTFVPQTSFMKRQESVSDFECLRLQKRIIELEKQLQESEMKSIAYQTMIDIAERDLHISIKKKFNTKPLKK